MILVVIDVRLNFPELFIFKQMRDWLKGSQFYLYKFRTKVNNAEALKKQLLEQNEMNGSVFKIKNDPRITRVDRFLQKTSMDEFPSFSMSLKAKCR